MLLAGHRTDCIVGMAIPLLANLSTPTTMVKMLLKIRLVTVCRESLITGLLTCKLKKPIFVDDLGAEFTGVGEF